MAKKTVSENSIKVLNFLKENGVGVKFTCKDVMTALGFDKAGCVTGSITSYAKKGIVEKFEEETEVDGKVKTVKYFALTPYGAEYDPLAPATEE